MYGDLMFTAPVDLTVRSLAESMDCPIYYYLYNHRGPLPSTQLLCGSIDSTDKLGSEDFHFAKTSSEPVPTADPDPVKL